MHHRRSQRSTTAKLFASLAILAAVGVFVSFGVFSAFSDTQSNTSSLTSATFSLTQTPTAGNLLSNILDLVPGDLITKCVTVTNNSSVPATVKAHPAITDVSTGTLSTVETMSLQEVTGLTTTTGACTGAVGGSYVFGSGSGGLTGTLLAALSSDPSLPAADSSTTWAAHEAHEYRVVLSLPSSVTSAALQNNQVTAALNFVGSTAPGGSR